MNLYMFDKKSSAMKKIISLFGFILAMHIYAQSPLSKFSVTVAGSNTVNFLDESTGSPAAFSWEFTGGNPSVSSVPNPSVTYNTPGIYKAKLTVSNASGTSASVRTIKITSGSIVDLGSGRNDDGTMMSDAGIPDPDWTYTDPNGAVSVPVTRYTATAAGWSSASTIGTGAGITRWITGNNVITGYHFYVSKEFEIPVGVTTAVLNLRSLSFVRNWTYLVKKNTDGSETETLITATAWMSDGARGWLNSRSPEVLNYPLTPGKYYIRVKAYTNTAGQRQAIDVNASVNFGNSVSISPAVEFSAVPTSSYIGSNIQFTNLSQGSPLSVQWKFDDGAGLIHSTENNPGITFTTAGNHYAELEADYADNLTSSLKIDNYIQIAQVDIPTLSVTQPTCSILSGSITVTSPLDGVTYSFDNGVTFQASNTISGLPQGTYKVRIKNSSGAVSEAVSAIIESAPLIPAAFSAAITNPTCTVNTGSITVNTTDTNLLYSFDGGATYQQSNTKTGLQPGIYQIVVKNTNGCTSNTNAIINAADCRDWTKAPNSYIFDSGQNNNGLYIPVKKAYAMWSDVNGLLNDPSTLNGSLQAEVYWEDVPGLIRSSNYILPVEGSGDAAKIKVEVDKSKGKGNAVIALKINNKVVWSWHVWVTDDPTNGITYGFVSDNNTTAGSPNAKFTVNGVTQSFVPKWMDRNMGATNRDFIGYDWNKSGGLVYQWGRKDPFPPLEYKDGSMYEINGTSGVKKHLYDYADAGTADDIKSVQRPFDDINNNVKYSINNPLDLIYNNKAGGSAWFQKTLDTDNASRKKANLWGDNSENAMGTSGSTVNTFKPKAPYDPCPNGWRIPSHINNTAGTTNHFSPWGRNRYRFTGASSDVQSGFNLIKPTTVHPHLNGIKIYGGLGMDFTNTVTAYSMGDFSRNMGIYPGNGKYVVGSTGGTYHQDPHEIVAHSSTMLNLSTVQTYFFYAFADPGRIDVSPDSVTFPGMKGKYYLNPFETTSTMGTGACRCMEDKYASGYDFPTEFFVNPSIVNYTEGLNTPNSYVVTKAATEQEIQVPVSKAFSVYNQYLSDHGMRDFGNLKVNVYWTDNTALVSNIKIVNPPADVNAIKNAYISVKIPANQSGNALVSLHNGNVENPVYWSWHIWVSNTDIGEIAYQTEDVLLPSNANYVNFTNSGSQPMKSTFMDRNLGATDVFPVVINPSAPTGNELLMIGNSAGMQYQWGRKDPIPTFIKPGVNVSGGYTNTGTYSIWKSSGPDTNGNIIPSSYTEITGTSYTSTYTKRRDIDYGTTGSTKAEKITNTLKYSSENPLAFMIPGQKYTNRSSFNAAYGQDWLYSVPNQMMERWGHATSKSPFDPCPGGWRVPDISNGVTDTNGKGDKGSSPWFNGFYAPNATVDKYRIFSMGVLQNVGYDIKEPTDIYNGGIPYYTGKTVKNANTVWGYQLGSDNTNNPNSKYKIGNYPVTGYRGFYSNEAISSAMRLGISGVWTAALRSANSYGAAFHLGFDTQNTTTSKLISLSDAYTGHPMNAMNVRCVKEEPRFGQVLEMAANMGMTNKILKAAKNKMSSAAAEERNSDVKVYPNPFNESFTVKGDNLESYELYDMSGKLIKSGNLSQSTIQSNNLSQGEYILKIITIQHTIITKKLIKK